ncbi:serine protease [Photobacterium sagamiensis]|uniref:S1 family peptidase n=1 Tax=Photobacterium sagamiensis TaxID=2910241 RepID=UPI003D11E2B6
MKRRLFKISILAGVILTAGCQTTGNTADSLYNQYRGKPNNKAYAIGTNNVAGAAWGAKSTTEAIKLAKKTCDNSGGINCNVTEVNGSALTNESIGQTVNNFNIVSQGITYKPNLKVASTGFFINKSYILTTSDVVESCSKINYERSGRLLETTVVRVDRTNNIAVLKSLEPNINSATISSNKQTKQGERTYTYGYDLSNRENSKTPTYQGKITDGIISSASGKYNDVRFMTTTNEVNSGNVGGPVMAENGDVIGIITNIGKESIKSSMFSIFLNELNIKYQVTKNKASVSPAKIAEKSHDFSVPLVCLNEA